MAHQAIVIGAGPAGLMAAEALADAGLSVLVAEAKPSIGRKLLMAGKSGLNLTKAEAPERFLAAYGAAAPALAPALAAFGPAEAIAWAEGLDQAVFAGTSGRVFPVAMKASPLLRAWAGRLAEKGVRFRTRMRWTGWEGEALAFETPEGRERHRPRVTLLALGGASWPRLGSDGLWVEWLAEKGIPVTPFRPANMGFDVAWGPRMAAHAGAPVKPVTLRFGPHAVTGEFVITRAGIEGSAVYALSAALRDAMERRGATLTLDLAPDRAPEDLAAALARCRPGESLANRLRKAARLGPVKAALVREAGLPEPAPEALARRIKALPLRLLRPRPIAEAISTAGGVAWEALDRRLMLRRLPGIFCAGEMLDWEAPTGGYLLTACLATGLLAGRAAARYARDG
ncbi:MAG TPA: TIGR03862 family flavoprotein [Paracoccaceae bacterium]|nr:TIGR03862 family flavoprotein [Paracoccaceae bacterium]